MIPIANPDIGDDERRRIESVLNSGMLADGPEVRAFEDEFSEYCGTEHAVATSNGTTALHATLAAIGIGDGDRVLTTPFSFIATANAIRHAGGEPVFADIKPDTYNLDPEAAQEVAREHDIEAILTVHLYGLPSDLDHLSDIAEDVGAYLIEDAAQAHGATHQGQQVGSVGDAGCFSFYPTKNMTTGEGGIVVTDDEEIAARAARFVNHGRSESYTHAEVGHNFRMTSLAGALGRAQLAKLPDFTEARRANAEQLTAGLEDSWVVTPTELADRKHVYHQYTVRCEDRAGLKAHLDEHDIGYGVYYPRCIHDQPAYSGQTADAPVGERAANEVLSLPVHPKVGEGDIQQIIEVVSNYES